MVGMSVPEATFVERRTAPTVAPAAQSTRTSTTHQIVRRFLISFSFRSQFKPHSLLPCRLFQGNLVSGSKTFRDQNSIGISPAHFDFAFFELRSTPDVGDGLS